ncbi:hypothetical protein B5C34_12990 [Pacificimonas flava]|uniref:Glycosyltransferase subfamily 4-like N-terminal domain-containing protein n=2 Tax=Pacificimonas TaxID=1960290 RepID=A0A219B7B1_9SPHN|nr:MULTISPECIES: hypothetical protein [Pacificimonas]MBZ6378415.1 hypothetical protein [Pacificimonas aurantium]OWV34282.1 hypothetical protein B5C34_12990 [Pacificimonas flava]
MTGPTRILFVSPYFPPFSPVGAIRMPHLAHHWAEGERRVDVVAVDNPNFAGLLPPRPHEKIAVHHLPYRPGQPPSDPAAAPPAAGSGPARDAEDPGYLKRLYRALRTLPDRYHPYWTQLAGTRGAEIAAASGAELIYSSGPPQSAHIAAARIKAATGLPWVAELRDIWLGQPYSDTPLPVRLLSERLGRRTLGAADAFVTVTEGAGEDMRARFDRPVTTAFNGFSPDDFPAESFAAPPAPLDPDRLTILHAGVVYAHRRDPAALFAAIARLPQADRAAVRALFYHDERGFVEARAAEHGVEANIEMRPLVPRTEMLSLERRVDVLLLCRWDDPRDDAVIPGKTFEYIGARRSVLGVGSERGEAAAIVRAGPFGLVSNDPDVIAGQLSAWLAEKRAAKARGDARVPDLPAEPTRAYTRAAQFALVDDALARLV